MSRLAARVKALARKLLAPSASPPRIAGLVFAANHYGAYCVPAAAAHRPAAQAVLAGRVWEKETVEFMVARGRAGDIVTAGTFFGDFLPALSRAVAPRGTVWAFEPNPENYRAAAITVLLNDLTNVRLVNAALGARSDTRNLVVRDFAGRALGGASQIADIVDEQGPRGADTVPVAVVAIDDVVPETATVAIVQLDVEGFEEAALAGAVRTIERNRPLLILETAPQPGSDVARRLEALGYRVTRQLSGENVLFECG